MRDADIRAVLSHQLHARYGKEPGTEILNEFGVQHGVNRIDMAVVNGVMRGYEIKSAKDTLARLPAQSTMYATVFDYLTLVASPRHIDEAAQLLPDWWGIVQADATTSRAKFPAKLKTVREARKNPEVDPQSTVALLWRDEAYAALIHRGLADGLKNATRIHLWEVLVANLSLAELQRVVREAICTRKTRVLSDPWV